MLLFVGLGNPGARYAGNRHNIGFMAVRRDRRRHDFPPWRRRFQGVAVEGPIGGERVLLLLPGTYMNEFGPRGARRPRISTSSTLGDVVVFHDEVELPPGKVRVKIGGGNAGHNGLRSITAHIGNDYRRVRIGIGHPGDKDLVQRYVLQRFRQGRTAAGSRRCATSSPTMPRCWSRARIRASRTRCISPWPPRASATTKTSRRHE